MCIFPTSGEYTSVTNYNKKNMKTILQLTIVSLTLLICQNSFSQSLIDEGKIWSIKSGLYPPWGGETVGTRLIQSRLKP